MKFSQRNLERARAAWTFRGQRRPAFAVEPGPGQESVWDYPRPPAYLADARRVEVYADDRLLARTDRSIRVLETGSPPTFYLPPEDVDESLLIPSRHSTFCEWKGRAEYLHVRGEEDVPESRIDDALWRYPDAIDDAACIAGWYACYPSLLRCMVDGETVRPQAGGFYGGWITDDVVGPFKGEPGTGHW